MIQNRPYDNKIDIWALGILLFEMIEGRAPFRGDSPAEVLNEMKKKIFFSPKFRKQSLIQAPRKSASSNRYCEFPPPNGPPSRKSSTTPTFMRKTQPPPRTRTPRYSPQPKEKRATTTWFNRIWLEALTHFILPNKK